MYTLLLLNGGIGLRIASDQPKQLMKVNGLPILVYSLVAAQECDSIADIILNYPAGWRDDVQEVVDSYAIHKPVIYIEAGATRQESVRKMLDEVSRESLLIHESARPNIRAADFDRLVNAEGSNVSLMAEIPFTVAPVDPATHRVVGYLDRSKLRNVQLPQKFATSDLRAAHNWARSVNIQFTEDATMVAAAGYEVRYIDGNDANIKVTTKTDIRIAGGLLEGDTWDD